MQQGNFIDVFLARHVSGTCRAKNTSINLPYFSIDNARALSIQKRSKFVKKNEHARYTLGMKKGKNLERLTTATSQARF